MLHKLSAHSQVEEGVDILWGTYLISLPHIVIFLSKGADRVKGKVRRAADFTDPLWLGFYSLRTDIFFH